MKITKIECIPIWYPTLHFCQGDNAIQKGIKYGYGSPLKVRPVVIVQLHTDEGIIGIGDTGSITSLVYMPDTSAGIIDAISNYFATFILGENPFNIEKIMSAIHRTRGNYLAKAAIDFALHDIVGKALNVPVYQLLGGLVADRVPLSWVVASGNTDEMVAESVGALKAGFRSLKVKVGFFTPEQDIENVGAIRSALGPDVKIGIDVNAGWNVYQAKLALKKLEKYDLFAAEQPTPYWDIEALVTLRRSTCIPIMSCESTYGFGEVLHLIKMEAVDAFIMKPEKGGLFQGKMLAALAKAAGLPIVVADKSGGIQLAAAVHLACSTDWAVSCGLDQQCGPAVAHVHGSYELGPEITDDYVKELPTMKGGYIYPPKGPGLGVELNFEMIEKNRAGETVVRTKGTGNV